MKYNKYINYKLNVNSLHCATEKHQIWFIQSIYISDYLNQISYSLVAQYLRRMRYYIAVIIAFFSNIVQPRNIKFGLYKVYIYITEYLKQISYSSVAQCLRKMRCQLADIIKFFSNTVVSRNIKFGLYKVYIEVNIKTKFHIPRSHSI